MTQKMTHTELRILIKSAGITQAYAAALCHASERTLKQWLADPVNPQLSRAMPRAATQCLLFGLYELGYIDHGQQLADSMHHDVGQSWLEGA